MAAGIYNIYIEQGTTFNHPLLWSDDEGPIDLTGWTARMQIRESIGSVTVVEELTTENGGIEIDGPAGEITLKLTATETSAITLVQGVYDLELIQPNGDVIRLLQGTVNLSPEVTR